MNADSISRRRVELKIGAGFGLALLTLLAIAMASYRTIDEQVLTARQVAQVQHVLEHLAGLRSQVDDVESGARGYLITFKESYLESYRRGMNTIQATMEELRNLTRENRSQQQSLQGLKSLIDEYVSLVQRVVELRRHQGFQAAIEEIQTGRGEQLMHDIHLGLAGMAQVEQRLLTLGQDAAEAGAQHTLYTLATGSLICTLILGIAFVVIFRDIAHQRKTEHALQQSNQVLIEAVSQLEQHTEEMGRLNEMSELLHSCQTVEEAYHVIAERLPRLLPATSGALGIVSASRNVVELAESWGDPQLGEPVFSPEDCWALRRGHMHLVQEISSALQCRHLGAVRPPTYLCVPLLAHGEVLGVLHLQRSRGGSLDESQSWPSEDDQRLAGTVGDQIALAVANLRLHDALRQQSVRDPLTGLFNRRYMEESLDLELRRAARNTRVLSILLLDIDHFKRFNDSFGHDAGDTMLREFSNLLKGSIRSCDIACRYGGEEFAVILPETSMETCRRRAEQLREGVKHMHIQNRGQALGNITVSIGIATFPEHGNSSANLLKTADAALYHAKLTGRDSVMIAAIPDAETIE